VTVTPGSLAFCPQVLSCVVTVRDVLVSFLNTSSAVAEMGNCLATVDMGQKVGGVRCAPFHGGELGPYLIQCRLGRGLPPYQVAS